MVDRLDEERLEILRAWGAGLARDPREELRAAGKAITVLIEEIDRLQVDLWDSRVNHELPSPEQAERAEPPPAAGRTIGDALRERLTPFGQT